LIARENRKRTTARVERDAGEAHTLGQSSHLRAAQHVLERSLVREQARRAEDAALLGRKRFHVATQPGERLGAVERDVKGTGGRPPRAPASAQGRGRAQRFGDAGAFARTLRE